MRWTCTAGLGLALCLAVPATAQTPEELAKYCSDPHPEVRMLACTIIIDEGMAPDDVLADALTNRGTAHLVMDDSDAGIADFDRALELDPGHTLTYAHRGSAYLAKGDYDHALADYDRAVMLVPNYIDALYGRASAHRGKGENAAAIDDYSRVLALEPRYVEAYAYRGLTYRSAEDYDRAIADFDQVIARVPRDPGALILRGSVYREKGDMDRAIVDFDDALSLDANDIGALTNRGFTEMLSGRFAQAGTDFARAVELQPGYAYNALWLDLARRKAGDAGIGELTRNVARFDLSKWPGPVIRLYRGEGTPEDLRGAAAKGESDKALSDQTCETAYYSGELDLIAGNAGAARSEFETAVNTCTHSYMEYSAARHELRGLR